MALRNRLFQMLESSLPEDRASQLVDGALILLILLNLVAIMLESVPSLHDRWHPQFHAFETFSVAVFSIEYLLRVWSSVEHPEHVGRGALVARLRYMLTPMALVDLLAILPFYLSFLFILDLRFMRAVRLLRIFKLTRYFSALGVLLEVLREESRTFGAALFVLLVIMMMASAGIYLFEHQAQPQAFGSIPAAMWWAMATLTTVGYGDVTPITVGGKIFGACITIVGIGMVALPAGILASGFADHLHARKAHYSDRVRDALRDGVISDDEHRELEAVRQQLALSRGDAERIRGQVEQHGHHGRGNCPHCNRPL